MVPLSRPEMLPRVRDNLACQRVRPRVCVVENGRAVGACLAAGFQPDALLSSEPHQSVARNTALEHLQTKVPDSYWVAMDDDDLYGPEYVAEHVGLAKHGTLVGKTTHWVLFEERFLAVFRPWECNGSARHLNGATLGAFVRESPPFPIMGCGEDGAFASAFRARGGKTYHSSSYHTAYCRRGDGRGDHTFQAETLDFIKVMGGEYLSFSPKRLDLMRAEMPIVGGKLLSWPNLPG